jgi:hypothetical protein
MTLELVQVEPPMNDHLGGTMQLQLQEAGSRQKFPHPIAKCQPGRCIAVEGLKSRGWDAEQVRNGNNLKIRLFLEREGESRAHGKPGWRSSIICWGWQGFLCYVRLGWDVIAHHSRCLNLGGCKGGNRVLALWGTGEARDWMFWEENWERWDEGKADEGR